jgi:tripartite-type tricarboxylate transporter receptor subunit TctC
MEKTAKTAKYLAILLAVALVLLTGCGGSAPATSTPATSTSTPASAAANPADKFPENHIICVFSSGVGSGGDVLLRTLGSALAAQNALNGYSFVIENRLGGGGATAFRYVAEQKPNGYTLLGTSAGIATGKLMTGVPMDHHDFEMVCTLAADPQFIYVPADAPYKTLPELIEYAKANPGKLNWGVSQPTAVSTLVSAILLGTTGIDVKTVGFEDAASLFTAVLGKHVDVGFDEYGGIDAQVKAGNIRVLASFTDERSKTYPDVPTAKELSFDIVVKKVRGIMAPKGTPKEIIEKLQEIFKKGYDTESFQKYLLDNGSDPLYLAGEEAIGAYNVLEETTRKYMSVLKG